MQLACACSIAMKHALKTIQCIVTVADSYQMVDNRMGTHSCVLEVRANSDGTEAWEWTIVVAATAWICYGRTRRQDSETYTMCMDHASCREDEGILL